MTREQKESLVKKVVLFYFLFWFIYGTYGVVTKNPFFLGNPSEKKVQVFQNRNLVEIIEEPFTISLCVQPDGIVAGTALLYCNNCRLWLWLVCMDRKGIRHFLIFV